MQVSSNTHSLGRVVRASRAYVYASLLERELRRHIAETLVREYGDDLQSELEAVDRGVVVQAEKRRNDARSRGEILEEADDSTLAFCTLPQLRTVMDRRWNLFGSTLGDKSRLFYDLGRVEVARNAIAHSRGISEDRLAELEEICIGVLARLGSVELSSDAVERLRPLDLIELLVSDRLLDVVGVYVDRANLQRHLPVDQLVETASSVDASGLSLNTVAQLSSARKLKQRFEAGMRARLLLLDPGGNAIVAREQEEGYDSPTLVSLTETNLRHLDSLSASVEPGALEIRVHDQPIRMNYYCFNGELALIQPYLTRVRGAESPTFVIRRGRDDGLFDVFAEQFEILWNDATNWTQ